ncbi:iron complex transport system substrate-binding protein [Flavobacterium sp. CF108]|uniref:ABC transporter substrate-binding protein n=1 Tax=unclassified Flavobacterium TaxID=196869 RepID=UPI0008C51A82|nr:MULTISPECIES: ABC transporter substrate-binding protein [unclassified Flavobacterium]SEO38869.1 iron complex transport system substrate-binding protein [Flavobacterium sp. fv08]SHH65758.1 iron complex transport system substrate-binding protein [Flavobacterium sp. CF108]
MRHLFPKLIFISSFFILFGCKKNETSEVAKIEIAKNSIEYASGLSIVKYDAYSVVTVSNPWPNANNDFKYVLKEKGAKVPDSLQSYTTIQVPLKSVVVTSTTNIPFLEMLEIENKLVGFPHTDYISSEKTRALIDKGSVKNVGQNEKLNIEQLIELSPDLIVTFGVDNNNPMLDNLKKSGLNVFIQADWMEQSPLGKAEWIKLYGALFGKEEKAKELFDKIVQSYDQAKKLVAEKSANSTVLYGSMYEDVWYVAKGNSWVAEFMKDAHANYLWADLKGTGSEGLSFEKVLDKAKTANVWIASGSFKSLDELQKANPHYSEFDAFTNKNVYSFEGKLGATGGTVYYELAPSRPDLVLKDYIKIFHPDLMSSYEFTFASKLN